MQWDSWESDLPIWSKLQPIANFWVDCLFHERDCISNVVFWWKIDCESQNCWIMFDNQMYLMIIWQLLPVSANFYLVFLFGVFDRLFDKIIDFEWSNAPLDWEIKFWNFIFPSHELIIDLEIVIRSFFDIAQIHQRSKGKIEPKYPHSPKYTHNTLCKRQVPFLTFSHPEQWFRCVMKNSNNFPQSCYWWWKFLSYLKSDQ